jgi:Uncharacterized protein conserved in archaea (DUF2180)
MNCYVCDSDGRAAGAVALCHHCGAALCREHLDRELLNCQPSGLQRSRCPREPWTPGWLPRPATPGPDRRRVPAAVR